MRPVLLQTRLFTVRLSMSATVCGLCALGILAGAAVSASAQAPRGSGAPGVPPPARRFTVDGRVSLPDDRPAARARVRMSSRAGFVREALVNDHGGFEFSEVPAGTYQLLAISLADTALSSETVELDTGRTATGVVNVTLFLRAPRSAPARGREAAPAVVSVTESAQKIPKEARQSFERAQKLRAEKRDREALALFDRAIDLYHEYFQALAARGDLRVALGDLAGADSDFARALELNPRHAPALRGVGYCKLEAKDYEQAAALLERAVGGDPLNVGSYLLLGVAHVQLDRRERAREALQQALRLDPVLAARAHLHLANLHARDGNYQQAADELSLYLQATPIDPQAGELRQVEARWRARASESVLPARH